tara:strand:+ start:104962 stop:106107 length:1146 start_codon:yes stop_codon:yes gene_type:complete
MSEYERRSPLATPLVVLALVGGGWFFFQTFQIEGLDQVSIYKKGQVDVQEFVSYGDAPTFAIEPVGQSQADGQVRASVTTGNVSDNPFRAAASSTLGSMAAPVVGPDRRDRARRRRVPNLRIGSWALDGFDNAKLADDATRRNIVRIVRQFDLVAIQQISSLQADVLPLLVDATNGNVAPGLPPRYDFILGEPIGPADARERLAFIFDTDRVRVDRSQTYVVADPENQMSYEPLVAWFQTSEADPSFAWTFSFVNVRIDLGRAPSEVALLPSMMHAIRRDGRGEDDVVVAGLLQADDAYLLPDVMGDDVRAAVRTDSTDLLGKHQTCNILVDIDSTSEFVGRGGVLDFLRVYNLTLEDAQKVSKHLPVYGEFTATEGGPLR